MTLTAEQRDILCHSLGADYPEKIRRNKGRAYRNYYAANPEDRRLDPLVEAGLMTRGRCPDWAGGLVYYHVTQAGADAVGSKLPKD